MNSAATPAPFDGIFGGSLVRGLRLLTQTGGNASLTCVSRGPLQLVFGR